MFFENTSHLALVTLPLRENWLISSISFARNCTSVKCVRPVPIMENCSGIQPSKYKLYKAGASLRAFRSPVPPKMINMVDCDLISILMILCVQKKIKIELAFGYPLGM